ncbi:MAG TPA: folate-binding protein [Acidobacteriaceae bacterium]|jgi:folate-binding protein YgfZ
MSHDIQNDLQQLREGAAIATLRDRAFLRIKGSDATRWLNGMVTNSIQALKPGEGNYSFLLNAQGRIQGDCTVYRELHDGDAVFLLETDATQLDTIEALLDKFIIMDDVELERLTLFGFAIIGPRAFHKLAHLVLGDDEEVLAAAAASPAGILHSQPFGSDVRVLHVPLPGTPAYELWFPEEAAADSLREKLHALGVSEVSAEALEAFRILEGRPRFGTDIRDRDLPQETNQTHALHFAKGCYLGQEIVERIRSRGQVHRLFTPFRLIGEFPALPATLETVIAGQTKSGGELTSAVRIGDEIYALGYGRREALETNQTLTYPGGTAEPVSSSSHS